MAALVVLASRSVMCGTQQSMKYRFPWLTPHSKHNFTWLHQVPLKQSWKVTVMQWRAWSLAHHQAEAGEATIRVTPPQAHLQGLGLSMLFPPAGRGPGRGTSVSHSCSGKTSSPQGEKAQCKWWDLKPLLCLFPLDPRSITLSRQGSNKPALGGCLVFCLCLAGSRLGKITSSLTCWYTQDSF